MPENTRHTRKYPKYPEIPESKKDTRKYPIVYFDTPTRPEPDPLPGILSNTQPDPSLKNPTRWALQTTGSASDETPQILAMIMSIEQPSTISRSSYEITWETDDI